jgi:hypothetical protein
MIGTFHACLLYTCPAPGIKVERRVALVGECKEVFVLVIGTESILITLLLLEIVIESLSLFT